MLWSFQLNQLGSELCSDQKLLRFCVNEFSIAKQKHVCVVVKDSKVVNSMWLCFLVDILFLQC